MNKTDISILQLSEAGRKALAEHRRMLDFIERLARQGEEATSDDEEGWDIINPNDIVDEAARIFNAIDRTGGV